MKEVKIGEPIYAIVENKLFGARVVSGILTGYEHTEKGLLYIIRFGENRWVVDNGYTNKEELVKDLLKDIADLDRVKETHGLTLKYVK